MRAGVIVAGGYSTRFEGGDKALASLGDTPMLRHVADRIAPEIETLVINGRLEQLEDFSAAMEGYQLPVDYAPDEDPGRGPVAGIATGLAALDPPVESAFVVACDMPYVDADVVAALFERFDNDGADAVVPRDDDGWYQVLHAVYDPEPMVDACRRALVEDNRKILAPLSYLDVVHVESAELAGSTRSFENINTAAALTNARQHLRDA